MSGLDWIILIAYLAALVLLGLRLSRRKDGADDFFLAGRSMPTWAASVSLVATALSAATFIGVPEFAYRHNLTYLMMLVGSTIGALLAAWLLVPKLYRAGTMTIYGYLEGRLGRGAAQAAAVTFLLGQLLSAGARHFMAAIAVSYLLFGNLSMTSLIVAILMMGVIGTIYTVAGGIRAVIWTDVVQIVIMLGAGVLCLVIVCMMIPLSWSDMFEALAGADGGSKLRLVDLRFDPDQAYTLWATVFAVSIFNLAQFGTDHDMLQRCLTCRSAWRAALSVALSRLIAAPIVATFAIIGLLLWVLHEHAALPAEAAHPLSDTREVFPHFVLNFLPQGAVGLTMAGIFAASMSSFDSSVNAMAATWVGHLGRGDAAAVSLRQSRWTCLAMGAVLTLVAILAAWLQTLGGQNLVDFALGVMTFAYAGLLGVFLCAVWTRRGSAASVTAALIAGALVILLLQPWMMAYWSPWLSGGRAWRLAWPWWMVVALPITFLICAATSSDGPMRAKASRS